MSWTTFDIETAPLPDDELFQVVPPFDPESVKHGRTKDPEKIAAKIKEQSESYCDDVRSKAALCPSTGRVLLIATCDVQSGDVQIIDGDEVDILTSWWELATSAKNDRTRLAGVNIFDFDLRFLVLRSWILGIEVPRFVVDLSSKWMNFDPTFFDIRAAWQLGNRMASSSFDLIGRALRTGGKSAGDHGAGFAELYATDRESAVKYVLNDVRQPAIWLTKLGLAQPAEWMKVPSQQPLLIEDTDELNSSLDDI